MAFKVFIICAFAFMIQSIASQRRCGGSSNSYQSIAVSDNGGPLIVTSVGPIVPSGIALATELGLSGNLDICGTLPYLSAVAFEGQYPTSGIAPVNYGCGNGVAINQAIGGASGYSSCGCALG